VKTLVVETGVIGTIYGWALSQAGSDVTHPFEVAKLPVFLSKSHWIFSTNGKDTR
jgi:ketopantoate reductase